MQSRRSIGPSSVGPLSQRENFRAQRSDAQTGQFGQRPSYGLPATDTGGLHAPGQHLARFAAAFGHRFVAAPGFAGRETASAIRPRLGPASETDSLPASLGAPDSLAGRRDLRPRRDTISLSGVSWISLVAPGFGQIYNKQYWKLPILYGTVGAGLTLFFHETTPTNLSNDNTTPCWRTVRPARRSWTTYNPV